MKNHVFAKRKGISTVLTTVIILVASVVLGSGVVLYGTSIFQTVAQQESVEVQGIQLWVKGVRNNGDQILSVDTISIKGTTVPFANWYFDSDQTRVTTGNYQSQYVHEGTAGAGTIMNSSPATDGLCVGADIEIDFDGATGEPTLCLVLEKEQSSISRWHQEH
jgi:hypothetical protein